MPACAPIFIGGLFKSGTSLLRVMLGQHPRIAAGLETYWFDLDWTARDSEGVAARIERLRRFFDFMPVDMATLVEGSDSAEAFLDSMLTTWARRQGKPRWCEKTPGNISHLDRIFDHWPDARVIHVVRNPYDVLASITEAGRNDWVRAFPDLWVSFLGTGETQRGALGLGPDRLLELRYEHLIRDTEATIHRALAFVGEPFDPAAARFTGCDVDFNKVLAVTGKASTTLKRLRTPLGDDRLGLSRTVLTPQQCEAVRQAVAARGFGGLFDRVVAESHGQG